MSGYGPKNDPDQSGQPNERKVNLSFAQKLPKADLKNAKGMKIYLDVITQVLPSVSMPAAAFAKGHDFQNVDPDKYSFITMMKKVQIKRILESSFVETYSNHEEPATLGEVFSGRTLISADQVLRPTLALSSTEDTLTTLASFRADVEKMEHIRTTLMLKTHSETPRLCNFLAINNFKEYSNWAEWSAAVYKRWLQIDFENIDHFDILKFVLTNTSRKYKVIIQEILLYHPDADYQEMNDLVSKWEEMNLTLNSRFYSQQSQNRDNPRNRGIANTSANVTNITRSDGSRQKCNLCEGNHRTDKCPARGNPTYSERRFDNHMERAEKQGKNRQQNRSFNKRPPWKTNQQQESPQIILVQRKSPSSNSPPT